MEFTDKLRELASEPLETNQTTKGTITIKQSMRNKLRQNLIDYFAKFLENNLYDEEKGSCCGVYRVTDGIILNVENEHIGDINIEIKLSIKSLNFNLDEEIAKADEARSLKSAKK